LPHEHSGHDVAISAVAPGGLDSLFTKLEAHLQAFFGQQAAAAPATLRQRQTLEKALDHLRAAETNTDEVVRAALLRSAWRTLARLTGQADVEKILDIVFQSFCIGK
jgi:tRNA modification GTPase